MLTLLLPYVLPLVLSTVIVPLAKAGWDFVRAKTAGTKYNDLLGRLEDAVEKTVKAVGGPLLPTIVAALADGKLDPAEIADIEAKALAALKTQFPSLLEDAKGFFGAAVDHFVKGMVHDEVMAHINTVQISGLADKMATELK